MTTDQAELTVRKSITVAAPIDRAFEVFTAGFATWWPAATHHIGAQDPETVVMELRAGGRWFERAPDGTECEWGRVLEYEPPTRILLAWQLNPEFEYDPDPALATELEVRFIREGAGATRVELEHRGLEVHGDRAVKMRDAIADEGGWAQLLETFAAVAAGAG